MDYQELDEIRFDEIYEYDNSELDEDQETEYYDNQYYFGLATHKMMNVCQIIIGYLHQRLI